MNCHSCLVALCYFALYSTVFDCYDNKQTLTKMFSAWQMIENVNGENHDLLFNTFDLLHQNKMKKLLNVQDFINTVN